MLNVEPLTAMMSIIVGTMIYAIGWHVARAESRARRALGGEAGLMAGAVVLAAAVYVWSHSYSVDGAMGVAYAGLKAFVAGVGFFHAVVGTVLLLRVPQAPE